MKKTTKIVIRTASKLVGRTAKKYAVKAAKEFVAGMTSDSSEESNDGGRLQTRLTETVILRSMKESDRAEVAEMMRTFYSSDAVLTNGSDEIFNSSISECVSQSPYADGFVFEAEDKRLLGYSMIAHSFSTEFGRPCIWIEEIYLCEEARGLGIASLFFDYLEAEYPDALHRLEAENENITAMEFYRHKGFEEMPYVELYRNSGNSENSGN